MPETREIHGPAGRAVVQPLVMHLLLALADAGGKVVTREALNQHCWGGRFVADDSLNRAIGELRKALRKVSSDAISVQTVPKSGYRLLGARTAHETTGTAGKRAVGHHQPVSNRRMFLAGGTVAAAVAAWGGWRLLGPGNSEASLLVEQGIQALRQGIPDSDAQGVEVLTRAVAIDPDSSRAWGVLALAWRARAEYAGPADAATARANAEMAAKRALAIDSRQSDALTALATLTPMFGNWIETERKLRAVLAIDPNNLFAVAALGTLLMSTGQVSACLRRHEWLNRRDPLSPDLQFRRVYTLWSAGRLADMDRTADRALQSWPVHPAVWFARFWTLAFTDRADVALAMLADRAARPALPPSVVSVLDISLRALWGGGREQAEQARRLNLEAAVRGPSQAVPAIMILSQLGFAEQAFDVAQGFLLRKGPLVIQLRHTPSLPSITDLHHRIAMMLWVPATDALRSHRDFRSLCEGVGLVDYWRATATRPDAAGLVPAAR